MNHPHHTEILFSHRKSEIRLGRIREAAYVYQEPGRALKPWRNYPEYALVYLLAGSGLYSDVRGIKRKLIPGDLVVVRPGLGHAYGATPDMFWQEFYLSFYGPVFELWDRAHLILDADPPVFHLEPKAEWLARFVNAAQLGGKDAVDIPEDVFCLQNILIDIARAQTHLDTNAQEARSRWLARACALLESPPKDGENATISEVARRMKMTPRAFHKRFTSLCHQSPARYRMERRIQHARLLLARENISVKELAAISGFADPFHFSRCFRKVTGESPTTFRERLQLSIQV